MFSCSNPVILKVGSQARSIHIPWELVRNAGSQAPPGPAELVTLNTAVTSSPGNSDAGSSLSASALIPDTGLLALGSGAPRLIPAEHLLLKSEASGGIQVSSPRARPTQSTGVASRKALVKLCLSSVGGVW